MKCVRQKWNSTWRRGEHPIFRAATRIYRVNAIVPTLTSVGLFTEQGRTIPPCVWTHHNHKNQINPKQLPQRAQSHLGKKNGAGGIALDFRIRCKVVAIKQHGVSFKKKKRERDRCRHWSRSDSLEGSHISTTKWHPTTVLKVGGRGRLFNKHCWESWVFVCKSMKSDLDLTSSRDHPQMG